MSGSSPQNAKATHIKLAVAGAALLIAGGLTAMNIWAVPQPGTPEPGSGILGGGDQPANGPRSQKVADAPKTGGAPEGATKGGQTPPDRRFGHSDGNRMVPTDAPKEPAKPSDPKPGN